MLFNILVRNYWSHFTQTELKICLYYFPVSEMFYKDKSGVEIHHNLSHINVISMILTRKKCFILNYFLQIQRNGEDLK